MTASWPRELTAILPDGTTQTVLVTRDALLTTLLHQPDPSVVHALFQWLMFSLGALAACDPHLAAWTEPEVQELVRFLRRVARHLEGT